LAASPPFKKIFLFIYENAAHGQREQRFFFNLYFFRENPLADYPKTIDFTGFF